MVMMCSHRSLCCPPCSRRHRFPLLPRCWPPDHFPTCRLTCLERRRERERGRERERKRERRRRRRRRRRKGEEGEEKEC
jgi:hypothetical protein